jgi:hypothetical protein
VCCTLCLAGANQSRTRGKEILMKRYTKYLFVFLALTFGLSLSAMAGKGVGAYKLDGAWVAKVVGVPGQWTYIISADPSGKRAAGYGSIDSGLNVDVLFPGVFTSSDSNSPILVNIAMTGRDTASYYSIWYGLKELGPSSQVTNQIVLIGVVTGELEFIGPGKIKGTHKFALYHPNQDADGDGFPDEGETTPYVLQLTTFDTRLPAPE